MKNIFNRLLENKINFKEFEIKIEKELREIYYSSIKNVKFELKYTDVIIDIFIHNQIDNINKTLHNRIDIDKKMEYLYSEINRDIDYIKTKSKFYSNF